VNELGHDVSLRRPTRARGRAGSSTTRPPLQQSRLAESLREARRDRGLELRDVAVITGVRMSYLEALEAGDYGRLPEDTRGKNALRLFAKAVGLDPARMLLLYAQERRGVYTPPPELELPRDDAPPLRPAWNRLGRWLATLARIAATLGAALWVFNTLLVPPAIPSPSNTPAAAPQSPSGPPGTVDLATADVPVRPPPTTPPAAETAETTEAPAPMRPPTTADPTVTGAPPTTPATVAPPPNATPLETAPTPDALAAPADNTAPTSEPNAAEPAAAAASAPAAAPATVQAAATVETAMVEAAAVEAAAVEAAAVEAAAETPAPPPEDEAAAQAATEATPPTVTLSVTAPAWLEVYTGGARREGERLVYRLAEPGETLTFEGPVFVFTGNAGGVTVSVDGSAAEPLGAPDRVVGRVLPVTSP
jgi:cytoskeleton protein RodZ